MQLHHFIEIFFSNVCGITSFIAWNEMCHLSKPINNYKDRIISLSIFWQNQNEIHTHRIPRPSWNMKWCVQAHGLASSLGMLAYPAYAHKLLKFILHLWTKIKMDQLSKIFITSKVTCHTSIMLFLYQILSHGTFRNTKFTLLKQQTILQHVFDIWLFVYFHRILTSPVCILKNNVSIIQIS